MTELKSNPAFNTQQKGVVKVRGMLGEYEDDIIMFVKFKKPQSVDAIVAYVHSLPNGGLFNAEKITKKVQRLTDAGRMPPVGPQPAPSPEPLTVEEIVDHYEPAVLGFLTEERHINDLLGWFHKNASDPSLTDERFNVLVERLVEEGKVFQPTPFTLKVK